MTATMFTQRDYVEPALKTSLAVRADEGKQLRSRCFLVILAPEFLVDVCHHNVGDGPFFGCHRSLLLSLSDLLVNNQVLTIF